LPKYRRGHIVPLILTSCCLWLSPLAGQGLRLEVVYPREDLTITARDSTFVFGNFFPAGTQITVNGIEASHFPNNVFLAVVPVTPGRFTFRTVARKPVAPTDSLVVNRNVYIPYFLRTSPREPLTVDTSYVFPRQDIELLPGDILGVAVKASPGCSLTFNIDDLRADLPMAEQPARQEFYWGEEVFGKARPPSTPEVEGIYTGVFVIPPRHRVHEASIRFRVFNQQGDSLEVVAPGKLSILSPDIPRVVRLASELTVGRTAPGRGYQLFLPEGVKLRITGREGEYYRARLTATESVWIPIPSCQLLPLGTTPPSSVARLVRTTSLPDLTRVTVFLDDRLPFNIVQKTQPQQKRNQVRRHNRHSAGNPLDNPNQHFAQQAVTIQPHANLGSKRPKRSQQRLLNQTANPVHTLKKRPQDRHQRHIAP